MRRRNRKFGSDGGVLRRCSVRSIGKLCAEHLAHCVTHLKHSTNPGARPKPGRVSGSNAPPRRTTIWPSRSASPPSLTAPAAGTCSESAAQTGYGCRGSCTRPPAEARLPFQIAWFKVPISAGAAPYCPDSIPMRPSIISGWRAKYSLICNGTVCRLDGRRSVQLSPRAAFREIASEGTGCPWSLPFRHSP